MKIDTTHLEALLDPLGLAEFGVSRFVRVAYRATMVIFVIEAAVELALPIMIVVELLR